MRVKKFTADTMPEALIKVKQEFGENGIILHQKTYPKPFFGLFGRSYVEVTAGLDDSKANAPATTPARKQQEADRTAREKLDRLDRGGLPPGDINELQKMAQDILQKRNAPPNPEATKLFASPSLSKPARVETNPNEELPDLPTLLKSSGNPYLNAAAQPVAATTVQMETHDRMKRLEEQFSSLANLVETFVARQEASQQSPEEPWIDRLTARGIAPRLARKLVTGIEPKHRTDAVIREAVSRELPTCGPIVLPPETERPKVAVLVGPTGVGKTTTLSKLAATYAYALHDHAEPAEVVLVTADLYRMGAVEQLKEYAKILQVPLERAYGADEVSECIQRHHDADLILVDTAGSSQRNEDQLETLLQITERCRPCEIYLVVSATTKTEDLIDVIEHFNRVTPNALIVTKVDEATSFGSVFNALEACRLPISYITTGQMVPEDIEIAKSERLAELILPLETEAVTPAALEPTERQKRSFIDGPLSLSVSDLEESGGPGAGGVEDDGFRSGLTARAAHVPARRKAEGLEKLNHAS